ncbi:hypothetical protein HBI26_049980 [Parastagonospora nodorum]|nr:hypothetical protein HBH54_079950 [Parastagonospora nodorum]KAH4143298.1 hypothetical protein HBH45_034970 [Parastagonospora nodorum]KAH4579388.1 hypothetical protein HBH84_056380 [Parastagonospora nodorum]KAH4638032.1 hypothetical protein HBH55_042290 [Parastagonospora nodorum]KAH4647361.1 hypothetical protein HBH81_020980 [Parastagonospora nodorum]
MGPSHFSNSSSSSHHPQDSPSSNALPTPSSQLRISRLLQQTAIQAPFLQGTLSHSITGPIYFVNNLNNSQWPPSTCPSSPAANTLSTS